MTPLEPSHATRPDPALELDAYVAAFEAAAAEGTDADPGEYLPPPDHPLYTAILRELVRVDLELAWSRGVRRMVEEYRDRFPDLFLDSATVRDLVREEFRLRKAAGESPEPREYRDRLGVDIASALPELQRTCNLGEPGAAWREDRAPASRGHDPAGLSPHERTRPRGVWASVSCPRNGAGWTAGRGQVVHTTGRRACHSRPPSTHQHRPDLRGAPGRSVHRARSCRSSAGPRSPT